MSTALDIAEEFLRRIEASAQGTGIALPQKRYFRMGDPEPIEEAVIVGVAGIGPYLDLTGRLGMERCTPPMTATIRALIIRAWICQDNQGNDDIEQVRQASEAMAADSEILWDCVWQQEAYLGPSQVNIDSQISGGLVAVSAVYTIGIH